MHSADLWRRWNERGLSRQSAERFEVRADAGRLWLPIHTAKGEEIGAQGWMPDAEERKYLFTLEPGRSLKLLVFNLHRVKGKGGRVFVAEGTLDAVSVVQAGFPCVALLGASAGLSIARLAVLARYFNRIIYMTDNDQPGRDDGEEALEAGRKLDLNIHAFAPKVKRVDDPDKWCKDANDVLRYNGMEQLISLLRNADNTFGVGT